jgi:nucleoside-diphosphate-sugar epimerase
MNKIIITGASGFIGSALAKRLADQGVEVIPVTRQRPLPENTRDVDVFFHFARAGNYSSKDFQDAALQIQNIANDCQMVSQALACGAKRFVYAQTYNFLEVKEFLKGNIAAPRWTLVYSGAKTAAEVMGKTIAFNHDMEYLAGACTLIYGPGNSHRESFSDILIRKLLKGENIDCVEGNNLYDWVYIDDVAAAFQAIAERGQNLKTYYIGSRKLRTFREIVEEIASLVNPSCKLHFGAYPEAPQIINWSEAGLDELYNDTGWEVTGSFRESIRKTTAWIKTTMEITEGKNEDNL